MADDGGVPGATGGADHPGRGSMTRRWGRGWGLVGVGGGLEHGAGGHGGACLRVGSHRRQWTIKRTQSELGIDAGMARRGERLSAIVAGGSEVRGPQDGIVQQPESAFVFLAPGFQK